MRRVALLFAIALLTATAVFAQQLPPGKWWRRPEVVELLNLSDEQQSRLESIFRSSANDLIDLKAEVDKQNIALRGELDQPQLDRAAIRRISAKLNEARGRLFERELMMLIDMRSVLNDGQWNRLRSQLERMNRQQQMQRQRQK